MTPPDTNLKKQKRRHWGPLVGMALVVIIGVGVILYWIAEEAVESPGTDTETEATTPADIREGDVDAPSSATVETVEPSDPEVEVEP